MFKILGPTIVLALLVAAIVAVGSVASAQTGPRPLTSPVPQPDAAQQDQADGDVFFRAVWLTPDLEGTEPGQIDPNGAEFCGVGLCVVEPDSAISAFTLPFSNTTRVWVEYRNAPHAITVHFNSREGYGLGRCTITPDGTAKSWGSCEHDPLGDYEAGEVIVQAPQGTAISGLVAARSQGWSPPDHFVLLPIVRTSD